MAYQTLGAEALDYLPCRYGRSKLLFRGPRRKLVGPYVAMIGGTETYGKFMPDPFPSLTEAALGETVVNFGCVNAGVDVYVHDQTVQDACSNAQATVIQISGAQNMSNRFYAVHPRRNDRFLRASSLLKTIYREVDFTEFNFTRHLLSALRDVSAEKFAMVEQELQEAWIARMKTLISRIDGTKILLWMSDHSPDAVPKFQVDGTDPLFVTRDMLREVTPFVEDLVEVVVTQDEVERGMDGMVFGDLDVPAAREMLGTIAHQRAAGALAPLLERYF